MPISNFHIRLLDSDCWYKFTYLMANNADPDQLASSEANWSGSTLFAKVGYIRVQQTRVKIDMQFLWNRHGISLHQLIGGIHLIFSHFSMKTYVVNTHKKCLIQVVESGPAQVSSEWRSQEREGFPPFCKGGSGDLPQENFWNINAWKCVLMHFGSFWGPRISVIQSRKVLYMTSWPTCSLI